MVLPNQQSSSSSRDVIETTPKTSNIRENLSSSSVDSRSIQAGQTSSYERRRQVGNDSVYNNSSSPSLSSSRTGRSKNNKNLSFRDNKQRDGDQQIIVVDEVTPCFRSDHENYNRDTKDSNSQSIVPLDRRLSTIANQQSIRGSNEEEVSNTNSDAPCKSTSDRTCRTDSNSRTSSSSSHSDSNNSSMMMTKDQETDRHSGILIRQNTTTSSSLAARNTSESEPDYSVARQQVVVEILNDGGGRRQQQQREGSFSLMEMTDSGYETTSGGTNSKSSESSKSNTCSSSRNKSQLGLDTATGNLNPIHSVGAVAQRMFIVEAQSLSPSSRDGDHQHFGGENNVVQPLKGATNYAIYSSGAMQLTSVEEGKVLNVAGLPMNTQSTGSTLFSSEDRQWTYPADERSQEGDIGSARPNVGSKASTTPDGIAALQTVRSLVIVDGQVLSRCSSKETVEHERHENVGEKRCFNDAADSSFVTQHWKETPSSIPCDERSKLSCSESAEVSQTASNDQRNETSRNDGPEHCFASIIRTKTSDPTRSSACSIPSIPTLSSKHSTVTASSNRDRHSIAPTVRSVVIVDGQFLSQCRSTSSDIINLPCKNQQKSPDELQCVSAAYAEIQSTECSSIESQKDTLANDGSVHGDVSMIKATKSSKNRSSDCSIPIIHTRSSEDSKGTNSRSIDQNATTCSSVRSTVFVNDKTLSSMDPCKHIKERPDDLAENMHSSGIGMLSISNVNSFCSRKEPLLSNSHKETLTNIAEVGKCSFKDRLTNRLDDSCPVHADASSSIRTASDRTRSSDCSISVVPISSKKYNIATPPPINRHLIVPTFRSVLIVDGESLSHCQSRTSNHAIGIDKDFARTPGRGPENLQIDNDGSEDLRNVSSICSGKGSLLSDARDGSASEVLEQANTKATEARQCASNDRSKKNLANDGSPHREDLSSDLGIERPAEFVELANTQSAENASRDRSKNGLVSDESVHGEEAEVVIADCGSPTLAKDTPQVSALSSAKPPGENAGYSSIEGLLCERPFHESVNDCLAEGQFPVDNSLAESAAPTSACEARFTERGTQNRERNQSVCKPPQMRADDGSVQSRTSISGIDFLSTMTSKPSHDFSMSFKSPNVIAIDLRENTNNSTKMNTNSGSTVSESFVPTTNVTYLATSAILNPVDPQVPEASRPKRQCETENIDQDCSEISNVSSAPMKDEKICASEDNLDNLSMSSQENRMHDAECMARLDGSNSNPYCELQPMNVDLSLQKAAYCPVEQSSLPDYCRTNESQLAGETRITLSYDSTRTSSQGELYSENSASDRLVKNLISYPVILEAVRRCIDVVVAKKRIHNNSSSRGEDIHADVEMFLPPDTYVPDNSKQEKEESIESPLERSVSMLVTELDSSNSEASPSTNDVLTHRITQSKIVPLKSYEDMRSKLEATIGILIDIMANTNQDIRGEPTVHRIDHCMPKSSLGLCDDILDLLQLHSLPQGSLDDLELYFQKLAEITKFIDEEGCKNSKLSGINFEVEKKSRFLFRENSNIIVLMDECEESWKGSQDDTLEVGLIENNSAHVERSHAMETMSLGSYNTAELDEDKLKDVGMFIDKMNAHLRKPSYSTGENQAAENSDHAAECFKDTTDGVEVVKVALNNGELQIPGPILPSRNVETVIHCLKGSRSTEMDHPDTFDPMKSDEQNSHDKLFFIEDIKPWTKLEPEFFEKDAARVSSDMNIEDVIQRGAKRGKLIQLDVLANNSEIISRTTTLPIVEDHSIEIVRATSSTSSPVARNSNEEATEFKHENRRTTFDADVVGSGTICALSAKLKNASEIEEVVSSTLTKKVTLIKDQISTTKPEATESANQFDIDLSISTSKKDPDGSYKGDSSHDINDAARKLLPLLSGSKDIADSELRSFIKLIFFSFPMLELKTPSPFEASQVLLLAERLELPLYIADRYIDIAETTLGQRITNSSLRGSNEKLRMETFIRSLVNEIEILWESNGATSVTFINDSEESSPVVNPTGSVEVDLNNGYSNIEDVPSCHDEPWWKVLARLNGSSIDDTNHRQSIEMMAEDARAPDFSTPVNLDKDPKCDLTADIEHFWEKRRGPCTEIKLQKCTRTKASSVCGRKSISGKFQPQCTKSISLMHSFCPGSWTPKREICFYRGEFKKSRHHPKAINAVDAMFNLLDNGTGNRDSYPFSLSLSRKSYAERTSHHSGFFDVDVYSLYDASQVRCYRHHLDALPWENREVKQRFLFEPSISLSRNWFGCLKECPGNDIIREPVCRPKSMEMPMLACEWTEEWYKQPWVRNIESHISASFGGENQYEDCQEIIEEGSWEEIPECGKLKNVKLKIGDRISRVTPDLTCVLRRSRWRKKHFPHNTFPYK